ncbi:MAG: hypothetical protein KGL52_15235 [Rhodospirillales bacterium]|nr:hypothetical protein [Rhodospirillales bacterium]
MSHAPPARTAVLAGLRGALLLARGRPEGMRDIPADMAGAARSFWAAAIGVPLFLLMLAAGARQGGPPLTTAVLALQLLAYAIAWAGYAVLSHRLVAALGKAARWPRFIAVWNWVNVLQYGALLAGSLPGAFGAPGGLVAVLSLLAQGWALWLEWYAIRLALETTGLLAAAMMAPDVLLGLVMAMALAAAGAG